MFTRNEIVEVTPEVRERMIRVANGCIKWLERVDVPLRFMVLEMLWTSLEASIGVDAAKVHHINIDEILNAGGNGQVH